ncbi:MAG: HU family DNA-binding protein [Elusimicrobiota bacterium]|jgi:nucleoid DNA-binding protein|nr:HU family DNA-binding protein [Elusimicrobiota bacterium]
MNKRDIALLLSKILTSKKEAESVVNKVFDEISSALKAGDKVVITGFGSFNSFTTKSKNGHNPKTGEKLIISPMKKVRFKQAKDLFKEEV